MSFQYIAVEGAIGVGKTAVVERLTQRLEATALLEEWGQNPFLKEFAEEFKLPEAAVRGGAATMYPEFAATLRK